MPEAAIRRDVASTAAGASDVVVCRGHDVPDIFCGCVGQCQGVLPEVKPRGRTRLQPPAARRDTTVMAATAQQPAENSLQGSAPASPPASQHTAGCWAGGMAGRQQHQIGPGHAAAGAAAAAAARQDILWAVSCSTAAERVLM